jgi:hypothetical protein
MKCSTLAILDHDFSGVIRLLEKFSLTAALGEAISSECYRVYLKYPSEEEFHSYQKKGYEPERICGGKFDQSKTEKPLLVQFFLHNDYSKANFQLSTINLEILLTQIIPDVIPWIETAERKHDSVGYYNSTATTIALVKLNEYVQSTGRGVIVVLDTNTEGGEGKSCVDTQHGLTKGSLRQARSEDNNDVTTARDSVVYLTENNKNPNNFYYSITSQIFEGEKRLRRQVHSQTTKLSSSIVNTQSAHAPSIQQEDMIVEDPSEVVVASSDSEDDDIDSTVTWNTGPTTIGKLK